MLSKYFQTHKKHVRLLTAILGIFSILAIITTVYLLQQQSLINKNKAAEIPVATTAGIITAVDAKAGKFDPVYSYAYGPSLIYENGTYHMFFCSTGVAGGAWDFIRYESSTDGIHWTAPIIKLKAKATNNARDLSACDPSVVYFQGYYYMYYSSANNLPSPTVVQVARSSTINGEYSVYTDRGTWEISPSDPKEIIRPHNPNASQTGAYGAGEQTVVSKDGKLYLWYYDNSESSVVARNGAIYMRVSTDAVNWSVPEQTTDIEMFPNTNGLGSIDIQYDSFRKKFSAVVILAPYFINSSVGYITSDDGVHWTTPKELVNHDNFVRFASNSGTSSDREGHLLNPNSVIFGFGAPYDYKTATDWGATWGKWNLDILTVNLPVTAPYGWVTAPPKNIDIITGWVCEQDHFQESNRVDLYFDGPARVTSTDGYNVTANQTREKAVGDLCGGNSNHGYSFPIPDKYKDGKSHTVYAYGIDIDGIKNTELQGSFITFQTTTVVTPVPTNTPLPTSTLAQTNTAIPTSTPLPNAVSCGAVTVPSIISRSSSTFNVSVQNVRNATNIKFAVWSDYKTAGATTTQDDLKWYTAVNKGNGVWSFDVPTNNHSTTDTLSSVNIHVYADGQGKINIFCNSAVTNITAKPTCSNVNIPTTVSKSASTINVSANGVINASVVLFAVWSETGGQNDLKWYFGTNAGNGTWTLSIPISAHPTDSTSNIINVHTYMNGTNYVNTWCGGSTVAVQ